MRDLQHPGDCTEDLLPKLDRAQGEQGINLTVSEDVILDPLLSHVFTCLFSSSVVCEQRGLKKQMIICGR